MDRSPFLQGRGLASRPQRARRATCCLTLKGRAARPAPKTVSTPARGLRPVTILQPTHGLRPGLHRPQRSAGGLMVSMLGPLPAGDGVSGLPAWPPSREVFARAALVEWYAACSTCLAVYAARSAFLAVHTACSAFLAVHTARSRAFAVYAARSSRFAVYAASSKPHLLNPPPIRVRAKLARVVGPTPAVRY